MPPIAPVLIEGPEPFAAPVRGAPPDCADAIRISLSAFATSMIAVIWPALAPLALDTTIISPVLRSSRLAGGVRSNICHRSGAAPGVRIPPKGGPPGPGAPPGIMAAEFG